MNRLETLSKRYKYLAYGKWDLDSIHPKYNDNHLKYIIKRRKLAEKVNNTIELSKTDNF